jgi:hypothetical protein
MRFALWGLMLAAVVFIGQRRARPLSPLFFILPVGGLLSHRRRRRRW